MSESPSWPSRTAILQALINTPLIKAIVTDDCAKREKKPCPCLCTWWHSGRHTSAAMNAMTHFAFCFGGFLLAVHASLRFGDLQRSRCDSITLLSWTSLVLGHKNHVGGPPVCTPALRHFRKRRHLFLASAVSKGLVPQLGSLGDVVPDFMLPCVQASEAKQVLFGQPQALTNLRWAVTMPWLPDEEPAISAAEENALTLRSNKTCFLSATAQLRLPKRSRCKQGHHKHESVELYSTYAIGLPRAGERLALKHEEPAARATLLAVLRLLLPAVAPAGATQILPVPCLQGLT